MKHRHSLCTGLALILLIGWTPKQAFAALPGSAGGVDWVNGGSLPSTGFRPSGGGPGGMPGGGGGAGFNPAAGIIGGMVAGALLDWALNSGPSAAEQEAARRKLAELEAERARLQALAEEQARKARIGSAGRLRNSWDQQDKESRERLQGVFDVFRSFQSIDPFGDFLFHGVPIYRPEGGPLIVRHLDPDGLAARADEWGKALEGAEERAQALWTKVQAQPPAESPGAIGHTTPANQAGLQNPTGANEPGTGTGGSGTMPGNTGESISSGGQPDVSGGTQTGNSTVPNQAPQQPGQVQSPGTGGQSGPSGTGEGTLHYRTGAFGTREVSGIPGPEFSSSPFDSKVVDLRKRLSDIPHLPGTVPRTGPVGNIPVVQAPKVPMARVVVPPPTPGAQIGKGMADATKDAVSQWVFERKVWLNDPMHRGWVNDAFLIATMPLLFSDILALAPRAKFTLSEFSEALLRTDLMRRPGLEAREATDFWLKGQMYDAEFERMRLLAMEAKVDIPLVGGLIETPEGLAVRYDLSNRKLLGFRGDGDHFMTKIIGDSPTDVDVPEFAKLNPSILAKIKEIFNVQLVDNTGYSVKHYKSLSELGEKCGYIMFKADGTVERALAPWQRAENIIRASEARGNILTGNL